MSYQVEAIANTQGLICGEAPHWDIATQSLYFVDLNAGKLFRYDYKQDKVYQCQIENETLASFVIPVEGTSDQFVVGCGLRLVIVEWDGVAESCKVQRVLTAVQQNDPKFKGNRFNDGKCDQRGRLFAGTMHYVDDLFAHRYGELYKFEAGGKLDLVKTDVGCSNGLAWNEKAKKFYYIDSVDFEVKAYDYDFEKGVITSEPQVVFDLHKTNPEHNLLPDGMTIDTEGNLYVATFDGHAIFKVDPNNCNILSEIKFPCKQITSAAFGGPNLDILYVTTAAKHDQPAPAGTTYKVTGLGAKGLPMTKYQL